MIGFPLPDTALVIAANDLRNLTTVVAQQRAGMTRPEPELARALGAAVDLATLYKRHIDSIPNVGSDDGASELAYAALAFVYQRERWHEMPNARGAFDDMQTAYDHLKKAVDDYNEAVFSGEGT